MAPQIGFMVSSNALRNKRVLLVDDDRIHATITAMALRSAMGLQVDSAMSVADALSYLSSQPAPDLALLDFQIGQETSVQLAQWMRQQPHLQATLRVSFSGTSPDAIRRVADPDLYTSFIVKPVVIPVLVQKLTELLEP